ncbi:hypothetical protein FE783_29415 [Paenibacillus mesophilus]|uniref:hypothetical protein n=1 Tax=Paenibacillus mesophilus TaxID=2582849 RepID=UPI00110DC4E5|nr:hypothetical protein [Paenibacillus mesophilus]TMV45443.1 hypothetical protein FE783_29415 [Paenibacillus mesophilus]
MGAAFREPRHDGVMKLSFEQSKCKGKGKAKAKSIAGKLRFPSFKGQKPNAKSKAKQIAGKLRFPGFQEQDQLQEQTKH